MNGSAAAATSARAAGEPHGTAGVPLAVAQGQASAPPLEVLAQAIANLSADDRAKLAAMLTTTGKDGRP